MMKWQAYHSLQDGESDCGSACVRAVLRRHGTLIDAAILRESVGLGENGSTLLRLKQVLDDYTVDNELFLLDVEELRTAVTLAGPAIIRVKEEGVWHFVVVHEALPHGGFAVSDPLRFRPTTVSDEELARTFSGHVLVTERPSVGPTRRSRFAHAWATSTFAAELTANIGVICAIVAVTLVVAALSISSSMYLQISVDASVVHSDVGALTVTSLMFLGMIAGAGVLQLFRGIAIVRFGQRMQRKLSERYVSKLMRLPAHFFGGRRTGDLASRLDDVQGIQNLLTSTTIGVSVDVCTVLVVGGYLGWSDPALFGILLTSSVVAGVASWCLYRGIREASQEALQRDASLKSELITVISHHEVIFSHAKRRFAVGRVSHALSRRITSQTRLGYLDNTMSVVQLLNHGFFIILVAWMGLAQVQRGQTTLGHLLAFISLSGYFLTSLEHIFTLQTSVQRASAAMGQYRDVMVQREAADARPEAAISGLARTTLPDEEPATVRVERLSFAYPGTARRVIDGFSLVVPAGSAVHVKGGNASGKSTLLKLVGGLYRPDDGAIEIGGRPLAPSSIEDGDPQVLYLPENPMIINATVWENLTLGAHRSHAEVDRACVLAGADSVVASFTEGYEEIIREDRVSLSRGQLQRLALARALLTKSDVYLFDESFSGIDKETFTRIWESLADLPVTKILVAHREVDGMRFDMSVELDTPASDSLRVKELV